MRVVIAEDSGLLRDALAGLLEDAGHEVVASVANADRLLAAVAEGGVDACVVDVRMPPTFTDEGLRAALVIRARWPQTGVLVLSQYIEDGYATRLLAGGAGSLGYLVKDKVTDGDEFLDALVRVANGGTALDPEVVAQLVGHARHQSPLDRLSPREGDVLAAMAQGLTNSGIARLLHVSDGAVEKHVTSIFAKLDLGAEQGHRRVQAVLAYLEGR